MFFFMKNAPTDRNHLRKVEMWVWKKVQYCSPKGSEPVAENSAGSSGSAARGAARGVGSGPFLYRQSDSLAARSATAACAVLVERSCTP